MPDKIRGALICFCIAALSGVVMLGTDSESPGLGQDSMSYEIHGIATGVALISVLGGVVALLLWLTTDARSRS